MDRPGLVVDVYGDDDGFIIAYVVYEKFSSHTQLHYAYARYSFRKKGLIKALLKEMPDSPIIYTHSCTFIDKLMDNKKTIFNPFLFWELKEGIE